ncbi:hypothetical protein Ct9H90mP29_19640 [bacterium]|nr:MAG: hypothetical protein Ct9H90mP29_19640 [bacterium]
MRLSNNLRLEKNTIAYNGSSYGLDAYWQSVELPTVNFKTDDLMIGYRSSFIFKRNDFTRFTGSIARGYKSGGFNQHPYLNEEAVPRGQGPFDGIRNWDETSNSKGPVQILQFSLV